MSLYRSRIPLYFLLTVIGISLILFVEYLGALKGLNDYLYDLSFRIRGPLHHNKNIIVAAIDDRTLEHLGRWPLKRLYYARLLDAVKSAKAVAFDIILAEPSPDDAIFNTAIQRHGRVILPLYVGEGMQISYPASTLSAQATGHIHIEQDIDGVVRKVFHTLLIDDEVLPSFSSTIFEIAQNTPFEHHTNGRLSKNNTIFQLDPMYINFYGSTGTFQYISLYDILTHAYPDAFFKDKIVLVGLTTPGLEAQILTPFTQKRNRMPGVEVHAHILNNIFDRNNISLMRTPIRWIIAVILAFLSFVFFLYTDGKKAMILWLAGLIAISVSVLTIFAARQYWIGPALFYMVISYVFLITYILRLDRMGKLLLHAKEEWEETFNTIDDAIIIHNRQFDIIRANKSASAIMKLPFYQELKHEYRKVFQEETSLEESDRLFNFFKKGKALTTEVFEPQVRAYFEIKAIPEPDEDGKVSHVIHVIRDITARKQTEEAIRKNEQQLRNLTAHLQKVGEMERTNIAREIHDELGQALTVLKIDLSLLRKKWPEDRTSLNERTEAMLVLIDKTIQTVKKISTELRPGLLDDLGLSAAIEWQADEFQKRTGIECRVHMDPPDLSLDRERNTALFRIFQETLTNAARHAEATKISVSLKKISGQVELCVKDNGKGITQKDITNPKSFGLLGIQERVKIFGGTISITGTQGEGTTVHIALPVNNEEPAA